MNFRGILFDMDGVLLKSMEQHLEAWQHAFSRFKATVKKEDFYQLEGRGVKSVVETLVDKYQINPANKKSIIDDKVAFYQKIFEPIFYDGLFDLLDILKDKGKKMAVVTGGQRLWVKEIVDRYFGSYFSAIITSDDVTHTKPFPEPYIKGAAALDLPPETCIVIENAPLGIRAGKEAGMRVIALTTTLDKLHLQEADFITENFTGVRNLLFDD